MKAFSNKELAKAQLQAEFLRVLANPTRFKILLLLRGGECSASALVEATGLTHAGVAQHMTLMARWGIVTKRRTRTNTFYASTLAEPDILDHATTPLPKRQNQ